MAENKNTGLWIVAGLVAVWYFFIRPQSSAVLITQQPSAPVPVSEPLAQLPSAAPISVPAVAQSIDPNQLQTVKNWFDTLDSANKAQAYAQLPNMTADDIAGLYDIIVNDWEGTGVATDAQRAFWNAWRVKYHVQDGTYP